MTGKTSGSESGGKGGLMEGLLGVWRLWIPGFFYYCWQIAFPGWCA